MSSKCILGCSLDDGTNLHAFPENPVRRAKWLHILGVETKTKKIHLCSKHFSEGCLYGNRTSRYAIPDRNLQPFNEIESNTSLTNPEVQTYTGTKRNYSKSIQPVMPPIKRTLKKRKVFTFSREKRYACATKQQNQTNLNLDIIDIQDPEEDVVEEVVVTTQNANTEEPIKVEDFEMCLGTSKDTILNGRYVQLKDYLVVSYTTPTKLRLKKKVQRLSTRCDEQAKEIKRIKSQNLRLSKEVLRYKKLATKLKILNNKHKKKFKN